MNTASIICWIVQLAILALILVSIIATFQKIKILKDIFSNKLFTLPLNSVQLDANWKVTKMQGWSRFIPYIGIFNYNNVQYETHYMYHIYMMGVYVSTLLSVNLVFNTALEEEEFSAALAFAAVAATTPIFLLATHYTTDAYLNDYNTLVTPQSPKYHANQENQEPSQAVEQTACTQRALSKRWMTPEKPRLTPDTTMINKSGLGDDRPWFSADPRRAQRTEESVIMNLRQSLAKPEDPRPYRTINDSKFEIMFLTGAALTVCMIFWSIGQASDDGFIEVAMVQWVLGLVFDVVIRVGFVLLFSKFMPVYQYLFMPQDYGIGPKDLYHYRQTPIRPELSQSPCQSMLDAQPSMPSNNASPEQVRVIQNTIEEAPDEASCILTTNGPMRISFGENGTFITPLNLSFQNEMPSNINDTEIRWVKASFLSQYDRFLEDVGKANMKDSKEPEIEDGSVRFDVNFHSENGQIEYQQESKFYSSSDDEAHNVSMDSPRFANLASSRRRRSKRPSTELRDSQKSVSVASEDRPKAPQSINTKPAGFASPCPDMYPPSPVGQSSPYKQSKVDNQLSIQTITQEDEAIEIEAGINKPLGTLEANESMSRDEENTKEETLANNSSLFIPTSELVKNKSVEVAVIERGSLVNKQERKKKIEPSKMSKLNTDLPEPEPSVISKRSSGVCETEPSMISPRSQVAPEPSILCKKSSIAPDTEPSVLDSKRPSTIVEPDLPLISKRSSAVPEPEPQLCSEGDEISQELFTKRTSSPKLPERRGSRSKPPTNRSNDKLRQDTINAYTNVPKLLLKTINKIDQSTSRTLEKWEEKKTKSTRRGSRENTVLPSKERQGPSSERKPKRKPSTQRSRESPKGAQSNSVRFMESQVSNRLDEVGAQSAMELRRSSENVATGFRLPQDEPASPTSPEKRLIYGKSQETMMQEKTTREQLIALARSKNFKGDENIEKLADILESRSTFQKKHIGKDDEFWSFIKRSKNNSSENIGTFRTELSFEPVIGQDNSESVLKPNNKSNL